MTKDKARKTAVHSYANQHNLSYTQALASLGSHSNEPGSDQNPGVAVPRREGEVSFTSLSRTAIVTITAEEIHARSGTGQAPANVAECAREWWMVQARPAASHRAADRDPQRLFRAHPGRLGRRP